MTITLKMTPEQKVDAIIRYDTFSKIFLKI